MNFDMACPQESGAKENAMVLRREQDTYRAQIHPSPAKDFKSIGCGLFKTAAPERVAAPERKKKAAGCAAESESNIGSFYDYDAGRYRKITAALF
jgi:hypothetical protein